MQRFSYGYGDLFLIFSASLISAAIHRAFIRNEILENETELQNSAGTNGIGDFSQTLVLDLHASPIQHHI